MPDEVGTEATRSDALGDDDSPFGDMADDKPAAPAEEQDSNEETHQDPKGSDDSEEQDSDKEAAQDPQGSDDTADEAGMPEDLKVVVSIKGGRATIGVQRPSADPHIETFDDGDLMGLAQEVPAVTERARARWEDQPKHPAYARPAPPPRRRNRRGQGAAQDATAGANAEQAQQQTLRLF